MRIIRSDLPLVGIMYITSRDVASVMAGQDVYIKYDAFPYRDYGVQKGKVLSVSSDVKNIDGVGYGYEVHISLDNKNPRIKLIYGSTAIAEIATGKKRFIEVFFSPITAFLTLWDVRLCPLAEKKQKSGSYNGRKAF
jgi:hypothetical protein